MGKIIKYLILLLFGIPLISCNAQPTIWNIGNVDNLSSEFALAPDGFKDFVEKDFGYEDKFYLIGYSNEKSDFPYVIPGPVDTWGGTWPTSGWRINQVNILFGIDEVPNRKGYKLTIQLLDYAKKFLPLIKVTINNQEKKIQLTASGYSLNKQPHPRLNEHFVDTASITGDMSTAKPKLIEIPINSNVLKKGGNRISITVLQGSWVMFDQVKLEGLKTDIIKPSGLFIRNVKPAKYQITVDKTEVQPLLVNVQHLDETPNLSVELDGETVFNQIVEQGQYEFEVPMPAVSVSTQSNYRILADGIEVEEGVVERSKQKTQTPADYVDTRTGTAHSRWMIAPGPWMPFSMVKMSPDNQNGGWQAGYEPAFESIGTFSHIHEWTLAGLGVFATNGKLITNIGDELDPDSGYRSQIDKNSEEAPVGYYKVHLKDYDIKAEITATTRCSFQRYTFSKQRDSSRILIDLHIPAEYHYRLKEVFIKKVSETRIEGFSHQYSARVWSNDAEQDYTVNFVVEFDQPIKNMGRWVDDEVTYGDLFVAKYVGNRDLKEYLKYHYVPSDKGRFSNTMEYSYDDWCVGQLAKTLNKTDIYETFNARGYWWKNAIDSDGYCHLKLSNGKWVQDFDPFRSGANKHYVEGNAWQLTYFVPQDVPALANFIGKDEFAERLDWGFKVSEPWRYNGMNDQYWDYPVVQGNRF